MRVLLAAALFCASTVVAQQFEADDYEDEIEARDVRDSVWKAAHGNSKGHSYHGFEEMAHGYPGHPLKNYGAKHHARDVEDEDGLGDEDGFIDSAASFANNVARAVKSAKDKVGQKADEAVKHAKEKAGYEHDDEHHRVGGPPASFGQHWGQGKPDKGQHFAGHGPGGPWKVGPRDVEDESDFELDQMDLPEDNLTDSPLIERDLQDEDEEFDWDPTTRYTEGEEPEEADFPEISERDVEDEDEEEFDWVPTTRFGDDAEISDAPELSERDLEEEEAEDPAATAFEDDDEELPDPKLELEEEFDEGMQDEQSDLFERDAEPEAEPFNFFGWGGKKNDHKVGGHHELDTKKKGMKHVFARDEGIDPEDVDVEGEEDEGEEISTDEDEGLEDEEIYEGDGDLDVDDDIVLAKRGAPQMVGGDYGYEHGWKKGKMTTATHPKKTNSATTHKPAVSHGAKPTKKPSVTKVKPSGTKVKPSSASTAKATAVKQSDWPDWLWHWVHG